MSFTIKLQNPFVLYLFENISTLPFVLLTFSVNKLQRPFQTKVEPIKIPYRIGKLCGHRNPSDQKIYSKALDICFVLSRPAFEVEIFCCFPISSALLVTSVARNSNVFVSNLDRATFQICGVPPYAWGIIEGNLASRTGWIQSVFADGIILEKLHIW